MVVARSIRRTRSRRKREQKAAKTEDLHRARFIYRLQSSYLDIFKVRKQGFGA